MADFDPSTPPPPGSPCYQICIEDFLNLYGMPPTPNLPFLDYVISRRSQRWATTLTHAPLPILLPPSDYVISERSLIRTIQSLTSFPCAPNPSTSRSIENKFCWNVIFCVWYFLRGKLFFFPRLSGGAAWNVDLFYRIECLKLKWKSTRKIDENKSVEGDSSWRFHPEISLRFVFASGAIRTKKKLAQKIQRDESELDFVSLCKSREKLSQSSLLVFVF